MRIRAAALLLLLPATAPAQSWVQKIAGPGLGNPLEVNPLNSDVLYAAAGSNRIFVSRDRGYTWSNFGSLVTGGGIVKSVAVSPLDTLHVLAGMESAVGTPDRIMKSTDGGATWIQTWAGSFSYFGQPIEFSPLHPDTVYTMGLDTLFRSIDFGSTWDTVATGRGFNAWCDAAIRPDSAAVMYVGDNLSGIWKTADHGASWRKVYSTIGEIPSIAIDPLNPRVAYACKFGGGGGMVRTTNWGETWHTLPVPSGNRDAWWVTCSPLHPGYVYYGTYTGDTATLGIYITRDSGATWTKIKEGLPQGANFNYGLLTVDSLTLLALQSTGVFKYQYPTTITVLEPSGGEYWLAESTYTIAWQSSGLYYLTIEHSTDGGSTWSVVADSVPTSQSSILWTTPAVFSESVLVRISDALWTATADTSDSLFTVTDAFLTVTAPNGGEVWDAGSFRTISWTSVSFDSLAVDFSSDSGATWTLVTEAPSAPGAMHWTVPDIPTGLALLRLRGTDDTNVVDVSDSVFTILSEAAWSAGLSISDAGTAAGTLPFGNLAGATDGIDTALGESELPAAPPPGTFDIRWLLEGTEGLDRDYRDTLGYDGAPHRFLVRMQPGPGGRPLTLAWTPESLGRGTFILRDAATAGERYVLNMRRDSSLAVTDPAVDEMEIVQCAGASALYAGTGAWLLASLPVDPGDRRTGSLFPFSPSGAFAYRGGYVRRETLAVGEGFWIRTGQVRLEGCPAGPETVAVRAGWNILGSLAVPIPAASVSTMPESLFTSPWFGYGPSGYAAADTIRPGAGYWVICRDSGFVVLDTAAGFSGAAAGHRTVDGSTQDRRPGLLTADGGGARSSLRFGPSIPPEGYDAPPTPPDGGDPILLSGGKIGVFHAENLDAPVDFTLGPIPRSGSIKFSWDVEIQEKFDYILVEKSGAVEAAKILLRGRDAAGLTISPGSILVLRVVPREEDIGATPAKFRVGEWYPNPFNPSTRISLSLPARSVVTYSVFDVLGRTVASTAPRSYPAGDAVIEWTARRDDGAPLGSGVYFIELTVVPEQDRGVPDRSAAVREVRKVALIR